MKKINETSASGRVTITGYEFDREHSTPNEPPYTGWAWIDFRVKGMYDGKEFEARVSLEQDGREADYEHISGFDADGPEGNDGEARIEIIWAVCESLAMNEDITKIGREIEPATGRDE